MATAVYRSAAEHRLKAVYSSSSNRSGRIKSSNLASVQSDEDRDEPDMPPDTSMTDKGRAIAQYSPRTEMLQQHVNDETLLRVKIFSTVEDSNFYLPVAVLVDRELEMRKSAESFGIEPSRWQKSRLFREWRHQIENSTGSKYEICIVLYPENDCVTSNQRHTLTWEPWLTTLIRAYYNTGTIRIPDDCVGNDVLLALEYFGILYSPDQLVFDSFGGYLRVKMWSDYFTHRARIADWVVQRLLTKPSRHSHSFVTSPYLLEELFVLNANKPIDVLDGDLIVDPARYGDLPSRAVVYEFFNDDDEGNDDDEKVDALMRDDFCSFVQASLPGINVSFSRVMVTTSRKEEVLRAVLRLHLGTRSSISSDDNDTAGLDVVSSSTQGKKSLPPLSLSVGSSILSPRTGTTQPITPSPSTLGDLSVDRHRRFQSRSIFLRRSQTEKPSRNISVIKDEYVERPHDEVTPIQTPLRSLSPFAASPWRHDDPSVDQPRETIQDSWESIQNPAEFVRSLSEKIIRKTLADMDARDTIDHHHTPGVGTPLTGRGGDLSNIPSDEAHGLEIAQRIISSKNDPTIDGVKRNLLPTLELDRNSDRAPVAQVPDTFDPYQPCKLYEHAPLKHVRVHHTRQCDDTVLSVLTNPTFNETRQTVNEGKTMSRQLSFTSDFQTTVDALSATDEQSVQFAEPEETPTTTATRKVIRTATRKAIRTATRKVTRASSRPRLKVDDFEDDVSDKVGCVGFIGVIYDDYCAPMAKNGGGNKRKSKVKLRGKDWASEGTPRTAEETDEEDSVDCGRKSSTSKATPVSGGEAIDSFGTLATSFVDGILQNMGAVKICAPEDGATTKKTPQKRKVQGTSKKRITTFGEDWSCGHIVGEPDDDDAADDIISKLSNVNPPTDSFRQKELQTGPTHRKSLPPRPTSRRSPSRKQTRTRRPKSQQQTKSRSRQGGADDRAMDHLQEIVKKSAAPISKKRTESVMKNLKLLKDIRVSNGGAPVGRKTSTMTITSYDSTEVMSHDDEQEKKRGMMTITSYDSTEVMSHDDEQEKRQRGGRNFLTGFRRKK